MTSQDPSEVRCPACGRVTPLAPYCTHCGAVVPAGAAGARPHALDRAELERRIRERRGDGPFRRGEDEGEGRPRPSAGRLGAFVSEPADELARHEPPALEEQPRVDFFDERAARRAGEGQAWGSPPPAGFVPPGAGGIPGAALPPERVDWPSRDLVAEPSNEAIAAAPVPQPYQPATPYVPEHAYQPADLHEPEPPYLPGGGTAYQPAPPYEPGDDGDAGADAPGWTGYGDEPPRRGTGTLAILGFLVLGLAALLGGAFLFAAMNAPAPLSQQVASASATSSAAAHETTSASPTHTQTPSQAATPSGGPIDDFSAKVEPCASSRMGFSGCVDDGTRLSGNQVWVWVGFKNGQASTVIGVTIVSQATKAAVGDGSLELDQLIGCDPGKTCSGYMQMSFGNLDPGAYQIRITRDGDQVASTSFTVTA